MKRIEDGRLVYDTQEDLRKDFEENKMIKKLLQKKREYAQRGHVAMMFDIDNKIEHAWQEVLKSFERKAVSFREAALKMDPEDARAVYLDLYSIMLMADCFDFLNAEMKEIMGKYGATPELKNFEAMNKLAKLGAAEVEHILGGAELSAQESLAIHADELREIIKKTVKKGFFQDMMMGLRTSGVNI